MELRLGQGRADGNSCLHSASRSSGPRRTWIVQAEGNEEPGGGGRPGKLRRARGRPPRPSARPGPPSPGMGHVARPAGWPRRAAGRAGQEEGAGCCVSAWNAPGHRPRSPRPGRAKSRTGKLAGPGESGPGPPAPVTSGVVPGRRRRSGWGGPTGAEGALRGRRAPA